MEEEFQHLGLGYYESKALSVLLNEKLELRELSKKSSIPFGKIYSVVKSLKEKNLVRETSSRPKLVYLESASETIANLISSQEERTKKVHDFLKQQASKIDRQKEKQSYFFQIGTKLKDNQEIQFKVFSEAKSEVLQLLNIHHRPKTNRQSKLLWENEILESTKRGVAYKSIYPEHVELPPVLKKLSNSNPGKFQVRRLTINFTRFDIIDDDKVLLKLTHPDPLQFGGIIFINDKTLAQHLRKIFYSFWDEAMIEKH